MTNNDFHGVASEQSAASSFNTDCHPFHCNALAGGSVLRGKYSLSPCVNKACDNIFLVASASANRLHLRSNPRTLIDGKNTHVLDFVRRVHLTKVLLYSCNALSRRRVLPWWRGAMTKSSHISMFWTSRRKSPTPSCRLPYAHTSISEDVAGGTISFTLIYRQETSRQLQIYCGGTGPN